MRNACHRLVRGTVAISIGLFVGVSGAPAKDINVPADQPTIQQGIDIAADGDVVLVAPGTYVENIDFKGKAITVQGSGGPQVTTIDGGSADSVVKFQSDERLDSVLEGFRITHGVASEGGGILCSGDASPTIRNNVLADNSASSGGGIFADSGSPLLTDNQLEGNFASGYGGAFYTGYSSWPTVLRCVFLQNTAGNGGAIEIEEASECTIEDCIFFENSSANFAGAIRCDLTDPVIRRNQFLQNTAWSGGAIYSCISNPEIGANAFRGNTATQQGGAIHCDLSAPKIRNNSFLGNSAAADGGAISLFDSWPKIVNGTFHGNTSGTFGGAIYCELSFPDITGSIFWNNQAPAGPEIHVDSGTADVIYSDVEGGFSGTGNIDLDPRFTDPFQGDLALLSNSPCIDAADPSSKPTGRDLAQNPRLLDGDLNQTLRVDMGAYEFGNIHLEITGTPMLGSTVTIDTTGKPGLFVFFCIGTAPGAVLLPPFGTLYFDLTFPWVAPPFLVIPASGSASTDVVVPTSLPAPITVIVQEVGIDASGGSGNVSNDLTLTITQ